ncbi:TMhelix containing protein [Vibrio phage 2.275.O._10N.286.54.E11]|nr:TMhelix containing protein [Vibrio phage 2.275.O._10N.286.54.E11]
MQNVLQFFATAQDSLLELATKFYPQATSLHVSVFLSVVAILLVALLIEMVISRRTKEKIEKFGMITKEESERAIANALQDQYLNDVDERRKETNKSYEKGRQAGKQENQDHIRQVQRELAVFRVVETLSTDESHTQLSVADLKAQAETIIDNMKIGL